MESSHYIQLIIGLLSGLILLALGSFARERTIMWPLLLLIPFQFITSRYGSVNELLVYAVGMVFLIRGTVKVYPMSGTVLYLAVIYTVSLILAPRFSYVDHFIYLIAIASNFILFYLVYNFVRNENGWQCIWKIIVILNVLVLGYCALQLVVGFGQLSILGIEELSLKSNIEKASRLTGPFGAVAMTAEYFDIQLILLMYAYIRSDNLRVKRRWIGLALLNFGFLFATGNRGGIVSLVVGVMCFFYLFRKELGVGRILMISVVSVLILSLVSVVMIKYTKFNTLFDRLETTEFEGVVPDTRSVWVDIWPRVIEKPIIGHGPRLRLSEPPSGRNTPGYQHMHYPHNLYMYIFYTIGSMGLLAYVILFFRFGSRYYRATRVTSNDKVLDGIPRVGIVVLVVVAVSEMRMEFLRFMLNDYQHYLFMLLATFLALSDIKLSGKNLEKHSVKDDDMQIQKRSRLLSRAKSPNILNGAGKE